MRLREYSAQANVCIHANIAPAGDPLVPRHHNDGITRSGYQNIRGSDIDSGLEIATEVDTMHDIGSDVQGLSETNKPWTPGNKYKFDFMMQTMFGHTVTVYSSAAAHHGQQYQPGGNLLTVTGAAAGRVRDSGSDEWGRHCWIALGGKRDEGVVFITAYRVCQERHNNPGPLTAFSTQYTEMKKRGIKKPNPRKQCLKDLLKLIQQLRQRGFRPALMMDANGDWNHPTDPDEDLKNFISEANLVDAFYARHGYSPRTYMWGQKRLDYWLIDPGLMPAVDRVGYLGSHEGADTDHVYGFIDWNTEKLFQGIINRPIAAHSRDFLLAQSDKVKPFLEELIKQSEQHKFQARTFKLAKRFVVEDGKTTQNLSTYRKPYDEVHIQETV